MAVGAYFSIDGLEWNYPCTIERISEVKKSDISGLLMNRSNFYDVLGQYLKYSVSIVIPRFRENQYADIYQALTSPVAEHRFRLPYNDTMLEVIATVDVVRDKYIRDGNRNTWRSTRFDIIAISPVRMQSLEEAIIGSGVFGPGDIIPFNDAEQAEDDDTFPPVSGGD